MQADLLWHLLLALAAVIAAGRLLGVLFRGIGQPQVIGDVVAGILLGPSLLGAIAPGASAYLFPGEIVPTLGLLAQLGVIVYMFLVGVELDTGHFRGSLRGTLTIAHAGIAVPFALGSLLALYLHPRFAPGDIPLTPFVLFVGVAMSITAFPVLARILEDLRMTRTPLGKQALTAAAAADVSAWCLLAFVVGVVQGTGGGVMAVALWTAAFIAVMLLVARPLFVRLAASAAGSAATPEVLSLTLIALLAAALATEGIGIHALFGAFLMGAIIPADSGLARALTRSGGFVTLLLLPPFFAFTGIRTEVGLIAGAPAWLACAAIVLVATAGKVGGTMAAARGTGLDWRTAAGLGVLMNTRGLMELIVLSVGLDLGVISPTLFTMFVLMAIVTTMATTPVLKRIVPAN